MSEETGVAEGSNNDQRLGMTFEEELLSPDSEQPASAVEEGDSTPKSPLEQLEEILRGTGEDGGEDQIKSEQVDLESGDSSSMSDVMPDSKSMENILLEVSPIDESIDLGSQSTLAQSCATITSALSDENLPLDPLETESEHDQANAKEEEENDDLEEAETPRVRFDMGEQGEGESKEQDGDNKDVKEYFTFDDPIETSIDDVFGNISKSPNDGTKSEENCLDQQEQAETGAQTHPKPHLHFSISREEDVAFEEEKGEGLKPTMSTRSLSKFFSNEAGGTDTEGKSFFDTFTAGEGDDPLTLSTSPRVGPTFPSAEIMAQGSTAVQAESGGSVSSQSSGPKSGPPSTSLPPQTPPFPNTTPIPSPMHQINSQPMPPYERQVSTESLKSSASDKTPQREHSTSFSEDQLPSLSRDTGSQGSCPVTPQATFQVEEDIFSASLQTSEAERRQDAWIPAETTRQSLMTLVTNPPGTFSLPKEQLTLPGLIIDDPQGDPVKDLVARFIGDHEAAKRKTMTADDVPQDDTGLDTLMAEECWRAAVDLSGRLLTQCGQGLGKVGQHSQHTPYSLKVWLYRISLLMRLRQYSHAESECQAFGSMDTPDLYYEFYYDLYPGRRGSMVPFELRIIYAELPQYLGKSQESLDRLYYLLAIVRKILGNLENGLAEDGSMLQLSESSFKASKELWEAREARLLYSVANCALNVKDYQTTIDVVEDLLAKDHTHQVELWSGLARVYLQMGDLKTAQHYFDLVTQNSDLSDPKAKCRNSVNKGFLALGQNQFSEAQQAFQEAVELEPGNAVAINNMAVCYLYMGQLREALATLETLVHDNPQLYLQEGLLFNLSTLYELQSSRAMHKKQSLLGLVSQHRGNGFNVACLKMT